MIGVSPNAGSRYHANFRSEYDPSASRIAGREMIADSVQIPRCPTTARPDAHIFTAASTCAAGTVAGRRAHADDRPSTDAAALVGHPTKEVPTTGLTAAMPPASSAIRIPR